MWLSNLLTQGTKKNQISPFGLYGMALLKQPLAVAANPKLTYFMSKNLA